MSSTQSPLTILVTGASAGIGRIICQRLARHGHRFVLAARSEEKLKALATELETAGCESLVVPTDVARPEALSHLVDQSVSRFGKIDVLINNAGIECFHATAELTDEQIQLTIATNLTAAIMLTRLVIPHMQKRKFGRIINMASIAGKHGPAFGVV